MNEEKEVVKLSSPDLKQTSLYRLGRALRIMEEYPN